MLAILGFTATVATGTGVATLISDATAVKPGSTINLGVYLQPAKGWHTYWVNPGDSGGPTAYTLKLPKGWTQGPATWPLPKRLDLSGVISYGYDSELLLTIPVHIPANASTGSVSITGRAIWLTCTNEICKPANQDVSLKLTVGSPTPSKWQSLFAEQKKSIPRIDPQAKFLAKKDAQGLELSVSNWAPQSDPSGYYFYPATTGILDHSKPEKFTLKGGVLVGELPKSPYAQTSPKRVTGVLVSEHGIQRDAISIDVPVEK